VDRHPVIVTDAVGRIKERLIAFSKSQEKTKRADVGSSLCGAHHGQAARGNGLW